MDSVVDYDRFRAWFYNLEGGESMKDVNSDITISNYDDFLKFFHGAGLFDLLHYRQKYPQEYKKYLTKYEADRKQSKQSRK